MLDEINVRQTKKYIESVPSFIKKEASLIKSSPFHYYNSRSIKIKSYIYP